MKGRDVAAETAAFRDALSLRYNAAQKRAPSERPVRVCWAEVGPPLTSAPRKRVARKNALSPFSNYTHVDTGASVNSGSGKPL